MSKIDYILTDQNAKACAEEVVQAFETKANKENLEMDFHISNGKMLGGLLESNTTFKFDTDAGQVLNDIRNALTEAFQDDGDLDDVGDSLKAFEKQVAERLSHEEFRERIANVLRSDNAGLGAPDWLIPIPEIRFHSFEISSDDEAGHMLRVKKTRDTGQPGVAPEMLQIHQETGKDFADIIAEKQAEGDPKYEAVESAEWVRYVFHVHLHFAADYSPAERTADVEKRIQQIVASNQ